MRNDDQALEGPGVLIRNSLDLEDVVDAIITGQPVIPVIGPMAFQITHEGQDWRLPDLLLHKLPGLLQIEKDLPEHYTLEEVVASFLRRGGGVDRMRSRLYRFISQANWKPDETLGILASFKFAQIYLTTTPDKLLADALRIARNLPDGPHVRQFLDDNSRGEDLPTAPERERRPVVYHLFGKLNPDNYALTDSDRLGRLGSLLERSQQPKMLFQQLRRSHLLFLGVGFDGWLARFFLQVVRGQKLTVPRNRKDLLVDEAISGDPEEVLFLQNCSEDARIAHRQTAESFLKDLRDALRAEAPHLLAICDDAAFGRPSGKPPLEAPAPSREETVAEEMEAMPEGGEMKPGSIFLSYASEDREAALRVYHRLKQEKLDVWMDVWDLKSGNWRKTIRRYVRLSWLFIPVLSKVMTIDQSARPFRQEWHDAFEMLPDLYGTGTTFIHPIRIDDVDLNADGVNVFAEEEMHVETAHDGHLSIEQVSEVKRLYRLRQIAEKRSHTRHG